MSNIKTTNIINSKTKIEATKLKEICYFFSEDFTASQTSKKLKISRQTINTYYKIFRELLFNELFLIKNNQNLAISYIKINQEYFYYLEDINYILIENNNPFFFQINQFLQNHIHTIFIKNKKINKVKLIYNHHRKDFLTLGFFSSLKEIEIFVNNRLKRFRGINKENLNIHLKESFFRFNNQKEFIYNKLTILFSTCTKSLKV